MGIPSASPVFNAEPGTFPFAVSFDLAGNLVIANAGTNGLTTYTVSQTGTVAAIDAVGQRRRGRDRTTRVRDPGQVCGPRPVGV